MAQPENSCSYYQRVYKKKDRYDNSSMRGIVGPEYTPDFYIGNVAFRGWFTPPDQKNNVKVGIFLSYTREPNYYPIKISVVIVDLSGEDKEDVTLIAEVRETCRDWAKGAEVMFDKHKFVKYSFNDMFLFRYDVCGPNTLCHKS